MIPRSTLVAALVVIEIAIVGGIGLALRGDQQSASSAQPTAAEAATGSSIPEGGPHQIFDVGAHPVLTVDIGYADLTILTGNPSQIDLSVSKSTDFGFLQAKAPIRAIRDGQTVRLVTSEHGWSVGDDRMVTVVVPPETQITVLKAGDIKASGLRGEASFSSVGMGSVTIEDFDGPALRVTASNGPISLQQVVATRLDATSSDGHVEATALQVRGGTVESSNGRVTLGFSPGGDTLVTAETSNGKVRVSGFGTAATVATSHRSSSSDDDDDDDDESASQTVRIGAGDGRLDVHSSNGNIDLRLDS